MSHSTQQGVESEVHVGEHITQKDNLHVVACIADRGFARPEEIEDRIKEQQSDDTEDNTHYDIHHHRVTQYLLGNLVVLLSQLYRDERRRTHAHHSTKRRGDVHQRKGHGQSRQCHGIYAMPDEDAVNDII